MNCIFSRQQSTRDEAAPSTADLHSACLSSSPDDLNRFLPQQEQYLLDTCAQNQHHGIEISTPLLSRLSPSILYQPSNDLRRRPNSLSPQQYLLERAAFHANAPLVSHLLHTSPDLDIRSETLGMHAFTGGLEVWKAIIEQDDKMKDMHYGHSGSVVEHCIKFHKPEILRYVLQKGARVENEGRSVLQMAEIFESSEEVTTLLREFGADVDWREKVDE